MITPKRRKVAQIGAVLSLIAALTACAASAHPSMGSANKVSTVQTCVTLSGHSHREHVRAAGALRSFIVHLPATADRSHLPLVIAFPGRGESAAQLEGYSDLDSLPAAVIYAQGLPGTGGVPSWQGTPYVPKSRDDLAFLTALVAWASHHGCINPTDLTLTGKSDGAGFAELAACRPQFNVSVLLTDSAAFYDQPERCDPRHPVTLINLHGTADPVIPIDGDPAKGLRSEQAVSKQWAHLDHCAATPHTATTAAYQRSEWMRCAAASSVIQYRLIGDGHTWAGAITPSGPGATSRAVSATRLLALHLP